MIDTIWLTFAPQFADRSLCAVHNNIVTDQKGEKSLVLHAEKLLHTLEIPGQGTFSLQTWYSFGSPWHFFLSKNYYSVVFNLKYCSLIVVAKL